MKRLLEVHTLNVGFGDTILIKLPNERFILVDCKQYLLLERYIAEKNIEIPFFELVVATHPHFDHTGGLEAVFASYKVRAFWESGFYYNTATYNRLLDKVDNIAEVRFSQPKSGYVMKQEDVRMQVLAPEAKHLRETSSDVNNASIVIKLSYGKHFGRPFSILLAADAQLESWAQMLAHQHDISATVFKVPHHGSKRGCNFELLEKIKPLTSIVSTSPGTHECIPDESLLADVSRMSRSRRFPFFRTDTHGNTIVFADGNRYWVECEEILYRS